MNFVITVCHWAPVNPEQYSAVYLVFFDEGLPQYPTSAGFRDSRSIREPRCMSCDHQPPAHERHLELVQMFA
jgi:hypothetical protein